jgi:predicted O-linked N-acetylglucosamine transferase (SPINDLY family)
MSPGRNDPCSCGSGKKYKKCCGQDGIEARPGSPPQETVLTPAKMNELVALFQAGRHAELESKSREILQQFPNSGFVWKVLGASLKMQGKEAIFALRKATELLPTDAQVHNNLGVALQESGQAIEAVSSFNQALKVKPDYADAFNNRGIALRDLGRLDDALAGFQRAIKLNPKYVQAHNNQGNVLQDQGLFDKAAASYRRALELQPRNAEALSNLGKALQGLGQFDEAMANFKAALDINSNFVEAHFHLGILLVDSNDLDQAEQCFRRALRINPGHAEAHFNLGHVLQDLGQIDNAIACYQLALALKPGYIETYHNLGNALKERGQIDDAAITFMRALAVEPNFAEAHCSLGDAMIACSQLDEAMASYRRALAIKPDMPAAHSNLLFILNYRCEQDAMTLLAETRYFGDLAVRRAQPYTHWPNRADPGKCLRVGLVSADLRNHPVGYFVDAVLAALASAASGHVELIVYATHTLTDELTERIKSYCYGWHAVKGDSDEYLARRIRDDGIDILIDLSGHTARNRLPMFAWKPAPVQASWLGYFATTGLAAMDYLIADPWTAPIAEENHFIEKIQRLPETYLCFSAPEMEIPVGALPAIASGHVTFGCFNNLAKMNDAVVTLWARVLQAVPNSRLLLKTKQLNDASAQASVQQRFALHGIGSERLFFEGAAPRVELLATYQQVDIALDPFPYPGGTTSVEALWMGVPVLTLTGDRFLSHIGESILHNVGLPDWIAKDADEYVARAAMHAGDLEGLATLRSGLRKQALKSPIFDAPRFACHFETALREMWGQWCLQT